MREDRFIHSRYRNTATSYRDGIVTLDTRERFNFRFEDSIVYTLVEGDTLDDIAHNHYGNSLLSWVILEANEHLETELDLKNGVEITLPSLEEVREIYVYEE